MPTKTRNSNDYTNFVIDSSTMSTVDGSLRDIFRSINENEDIVMPSVLSHEVFKNNSSTITLEHSRKNNIIKKYKSYLTNVQEVNANRFFLKAKNSKSNREYYYTNLKKNKNFRNNLYRKINSLISVFENEEKERNFGNILLKFYYENNTSGYLGKIADFALKDLGANNSRPDSRFLSINNRFRKTLDLDHNTFYLTYRKVWGQSLGRMSSQRLGSFLINSDKVASQILLNGAFSLRNIHVNAWTPSRCNIDEDNELINSYAFDKFSIVKLKNNYDFVDEENKKVLNPIISESISSSELFLSTNIDYLSSYEKYEKDFVNLKSLDTLGFYNFCQNDMSLIKYDRAFLAEGDEQEKYKRFITNISNINNNIVEDSKDYEDLPDSLFSGVAFNPLKSLSGLTIDEYNNYAFNVCNFDIIKRVREDSWLNEDHSDEWIYMDFEGNFRSGPYFSTENNTSRRILNSPLFIYITNLNFETVGGGFLPATDENGICRLETILSPTDRTGDQRQTYPYNEFLTVNPNFEKLNRSVKFGVLGDGNSTHKSVIWMINRMYKTNYGVTHETTDRDFISQTRQNNKYREIENLNDDVRSRMNFMSEEKHQPFYLLENTCNKISISLLKDKFIKQQGFLTKSNEIFSDRLIISPVKTSKNNSGAIRNTDSNFNIHKNNNINNVNIENSWSTSCFEIKRNIFKLKEFKLKKDNKVKVLNYFNNLKSKIEKFKLSNNNIKKHALSYGDESYSIDNMGNTDFLISDNNLFFNKNNYSKTVDNILNTKKLVRARNTSDIEIDFNLKSNDFLDFASIYYPNGLLKNNSTFLKRIYKDTIYIFNNYDFFETLDYNNIGAVRDKLGYEKLLSDAVLEKNIDVIKMLVFSAICKKNNLISEYSSSDINKDRFDYLNNNLDNSYKNYIKKIFSYDNVKKQKSYTSRTIGSFLSKEDISLEIDRTASPRRIFAKQLGIMPGKVYNLMFPFTVHDFKIFNTDFDGNNTNGTNYFDSRLIQASKVLHAQLFNLFTYNYDVYLNSLEQTGENIDSLFDVSSNNFKARLEYIVMKGLDEDELLFRDLSDDTLGIDQNPGILSRITKKENSSVSDEDTYNRTEGELFYKIHKNGIEISDFLFRNNITYEGIDLLTFKSKIQDIINEILEYLGFSNVNNLSKAFDFINNNDEIIEIIGDNISFFAKLFSNNFDLIVDLSVKSSLNKISDPNKDIDEFDMWKSDIVKASVKDIEYIYEKYQDNLSFDNGVIPEVANDVSDIFYTRRFADLSFITRTLNNDDIVTSLTHDAIYGYLVNFEENALDVEEKLLEISDVAREVNEDLLGIEDVNIIEIIKNDAKFNKISKYLDNYTYWQNEAYNNFYGSRNNLNRELKNIFEEKRIFDHRKEYTDITNKLIQTSFNEIYDGYNTNYDLFLGSRIISLIENIGSISKDIIRVGINYDIANKLLNKKLLNIKVHIFNHKYPEVIFETLDYYYTPILTDIVPSMAKKFENSNVSDKIGFYDITSSTIEDRYNLIDKESAKNVIKSILEYSIFENNLFESEENSLFNNDNNAQKILNQHLTSNAVKYFSYYDQKYLSEEKINNFGTNYDAIISEDTSDVLLEMSDKEYFKTFAEPISNIDGILNNASNRLNFENTNNLIGNKVYSLDFMKLIDKDISSIDLLKHFEEDTFYDIFSIVISRQDIKEAISGTESSLRALYRLGNRDNLPTSHSQFDDSYSYIIEANVV